MEEKGCMSREDSCRTSCGHFRWKQALMKQVHTSLDEADPTWIFQSKLRQKWCPNWQMLPQQTPLQQINCMFCCMFVIFNYKQAKGGIMGLSAEALRSRHRVLLQTGVCRLRRPSNSQASFSLSFVHQDIDNSDKDMRWPEQRPGKVSAQFTWRDRATVNMWTGKKQLFTEHKSPLESFENQWQSRWDIC